MIFGYELSHVLLFVYFNVEKLLSISQAAENEHLQEINTYLDRAPDLQISLPFGEENYLSETNRAFLITPGGTPSLRTEHQLSVLGVHSGPGPNGDIIKLITSQWLDLKAILRQLKGGCDSSHLIKPILRTFSFDRPPRADTELGSCGKYCLYTVEHVEDDPDNEVPEEIGPPISLHLLDLLFVREPARQAQDLRGRSTKLNTPIELSTATAMDFSDECGVLGLANRHWDLEDWDDQDPHSSQLLEFSRLHIFYY